MYRHVLAKLAHARGWEVHCYDAKHVEAQAAVLLGEQGGGGPPRPPGHARAAVDQEDHRMALAATVVAGDGH